MFTDKSSEKICTSTRYQSRHFPNLLHALTYKSVLYLYFRVEHKFQNTSDQITKGLLSIQVLPLKFYCYHLFTVLKCHTIDSGHGSHPLHSIYTDTKVICFYTINV